MPFINSYWILFSVASYVSTSEVDKVTYDGAQVWRTILRGADDVLLIKKLADDQDISLWSLCPTQADFLVRAEDKVKIHRQLSSRSLAHTVLILDVQRRIETQPVATSVWTENTLRIGHRLNWKIFPTLNIIEEYYNFLSDDYSSICKLQVIGKTAENRTIKMMNITNGNPNNKIIIITAGQHAREWISITSALYILHTIVTKFDRHPRYIRNTNWLIIPVANPDGYVYTHNNDRLWRKNRRKFMYCKGVDINRNFETDWGIAGISENNECKGTYSGPYPFSEAESIAIRNVITSLKQKPVAIIDIHSYGNLILFPWSARNHATHDLQMHKLAAEEMSKAIYRSSHVKYTYGATYHIIYPATGTLLDWAYSKGVWHSYVIESRDKGQFGFLLPADEIEDTGKELFSAVRFLTRAISKSTSKDYSNRTWF